MDKYWERMTEGNAKDDTEKPHPTYVPVDAIRAIMEVREYGTKKYKDPENWKKVSEERYHEAMLRHVLACWDDLHKIDTESGLPHIYHVLCNAAFIASLMNMDKAREDTKGENNDTERKSR